MEIPEILSDEIVKIFRENYIPNDNESLQIVLKLLKNKGYSQMQSLFLLVQEMEMSFLEANQCILNSSAWNS